MSTALEGRGSREPVERTLHATWSAIDYMRVDHRGVHVGVPEQLLDRPDVVAGLQKMRRERVTKRVAAGALGDSDLQRGRIQLRLRPQVSAGTLAGRGVMRLKRLLGIAGGARAVGLGVMLVPRARSPCSPPCAPAFDSHTATGCPRTWHEAKDGADWCVKKHPSERVLVHMNCGGFNDISSGGIDTGVACYYDMSTFQLVGTRSFGFAGDTWCRGAAPALDATCASKRLVCDATH